MQGAVVSVIEPIFERCPKDEYRAEQSDGFRPERGCKDALRRVDQLVKPDHVDVVDADLKGDFDTIPHDRLMDRLKEKVSDGRRGRMESPRDSRAPSSVVWRRRAETIRPRRLLSLIESFLTADILDGTDRWTPEAGAPQGAVLSPDHRSGGALSNIYLDPLDHLMAQAGYEMVRYADDFVILCRTAVAATQALAIVQRRVGENGLVLHPTKTKIADVRTDGFDFLALSFPLADRHFQGVKHWSRKKSLDKRKDTLRAKTPRTSGQSLHCVIQNVNQTLVGWFGYFQHSRLWIFGRLDQWLRGRLRSLLHRHHHQRGVARGSDHQRWPNRFFAAPRGYPGLFSLAKAHASVVQSSRR